MSAADPPAQPTFYYDLGDPWCYLLAERILGALPVVAEWQPVLGSGLGVPHAELDRALIEELADQRGLQPLRWPQSWPPDTRRAMLAATYAKKIGRAVAFSLAAFRQAFAAGRDLGDEDTLVIAGAACELHPAAVLRALTLRSVEDALAGAVTAAMDAGVSSLPAIEVGERVFEGRTALEQAARALSASPEAR